MADPVLCVSCAQLPIKDRDAATRFRRCPECKAEVGVTSYGKRFRATPAEGRPFLTRQVLHAGVGIGAVVMSLAFLVTAVHLALPEERREAPVAVNVAPVIPPAGAPEAPVLIAPKNVPALPGQLEKLPEVSIEPWDNHPLNAAIELRDLFGQVRRENSAKQDGFLLAHMERRPELRGLPFILGNDCKLGVAAGNAMAASVIHLRRQLDTAKDFGDHGKEQFWHRLEDPQFRSSSSVASMAQVLATEDESMRKDFARSLAKAKNSSATAVLAKLAVFDQSFEVRQAALLSLGTRDKREYSKILMQGMRYPLPGVAKNSADAMIALGTKNLVLHLREFTEDAVPGDPEAKKIDGKIVHTVREVVRINHHRNCLLCHAPVKSADFSEVAAMMPIPGEPIPQSSVQYYGNKFKPDSLAVRADITYLRQDFSMLMPVANAHPWPELQRFDFLVRTRVVEGEELAKLNKAIADRPLNFVAEAHREARRAIAALSAQKAVANRAED